MDNVYKPEDKEKHARFGFVLASKMLTDGNSNRKVQSMYREETPNPQDSGWRFFCGEETPEYINNPDNIAIYEIDTILKIDPSIRPCLNHSPGVALEREENGVGWSIYRKETRNKDYMRVVNGAGIKITHAESDEIDSVLDNILGCVSIMADACERFKPPVNRYRELLERDGDSEAQLSINRAHLADLQKTIGKQFYRLTFELKKLESPQN